MTSERLVTVFNDRRNRKDELRVGASNNYCASILLCLLKLITVFLLFADILLLFIYYYSIDRLKWASLSPEWDQSMDS